MAVASGSVDPEALLTSLSERMISDLPDCGAATWLSGSDFDLLLGGQATALQDSSKADCGAHPPSPTDVDGAGEIGSRWQGFPSSLFAYDQDKGFGASFDVVDVSNSFPKAPNTAPGDILSSHQVASTSGALNPYLSAVPQQEAKLQVPLERLRGFEVATSPNYKSECGENNGAEGSPPRQGLETRQSLGTSPNRSNSWKSGILKKSKYKPRQRAKNAQVLELKDQVAELTAKCNSMEQVLSQQNLPRLDSFTEEPAGLGPQASPIFSEAAELSGQPGISDLQAVTATALQVSEPQAGEQATADSIARLTCAQFGSMYKKLVSQLAVKLGSLPLTDKERAIDQLKQAASEVLLLVMRCCMENSVAAKMWMQESFKAEQARLEAEQDGGQFWSNTAASLALSEEQKQAIVRLRQAFLTRLEALKRGRQEIIQSLTGNSPSAFRNRASAVAQLGAMQIMEAFADNVKECDRLICDFVSSLMSQILDPVQMARLLVSAYPYWPDTLAVSTYVAAAAGECSAIGMLDQELAGVSIAASS